MLKHSCSGWHKTDAVSVCCGEEPSWKGRVSDFHALEAQVQ